MQSHVGKFPELCSPGLCVLVPRVSVEHRPGRLGPVAGSGTVSEDCICGCWKFSKSGAGYLFMPSPPFSPNITVFPPTTGKWSREAGRCRLSCSPVPRQLYYSRERCLLTVPGERQLCEGRDPVMVEHVLCEATDVSERDRTQSPGLGLPGPSPPSWPDQHL